MARASDHPKNALVRAPARGYAACLRVNRSRAIDPAQALFQHAGYVRALQVAGLKVLELPPEPDLPDACFVEDTVVVRGRVCAITRPGAPSRRGETDSVERALEPLLEVRRMERGNLDGGDVMLLGEVAYVGLSERTDRAGARELERVLEIEVRPQSIAGALHLKSVMTPLSDGRVLALPGAPVPAGLEAITTREPAGGNVLCVGSQVLCSADAPKTGELLAGLGLTIHLVSLGEFHAGDAGVTCLSVLF